MMKQDSSLKKPELQKHRQASRPAERRSESENRHVYLHRAPQLKTNPRLNQRINDRKLQTENNQSDEIFVLNLHLPKEQFQYQKSKTHS
jgi:uncharacterized protein HemY